MRKLTLNGRLLNLLYRRNASTRWIRSRECISVRHYSIALAAQDNFRDETLQTPTVSDWLFQISSHSNQLSEPWVPLPRTTIFLKDTIDWEAAEKIFEERPSLAKAIDFGKSGYRDVSFVSSLADIASTWKHDETLLFEFDRQNINATNGPGYFYDKNLLRCTLTCNLPSKYREPPLKITAMSTKKLSARSAAVLQLFLVLEKKHLLNVLLSLSSHGPVSKEARGALKYDLVKRRAERASVSRNGSSKIISTAPAPPTAEIDPAPPTAEIDPAPPTAEMGPAPPTAEMGPAVTPQEETANSGQVTREVFNYAARYLYIPRYTATLRPVLTANHSKKSTPSKTASKRSFTVDISLPEHGIHATATGPSLHLVEAKACANFKREAEKYHIANAAPPPLEGPIILSTANARNFIDFYNDYNKKKVIFKVNETDDYWTGQAFTMDANTGTIESLGQAISRNSRICVKRLTMLVAAVTLVKERPKLLENYTEKLDSVTGKYVAKALPIKLTLYQSSLDLMKRTVNATAELRLSTTLTGEPTGDVPLPFSRKSPHKYSEHFSRLRSRQLLKWYNERKHQSQNKLPLNKHSSKVLSLVDNNHFSILVGQTGSGKTTQLPQIILDSYIRTERGGECKIICTQPRRIAATSVADRVATERGQVLGDQVGYHIASDSELPTSRGSITYCTTGIILQQLIHNPDQLFDNVSHLIIDEVHERDINIDFLLTMVKDLVKDRIEAGKSTPKVCFMSATVDAEKFQEYFAFTDETGREFTCPILHIEGRAFPVEKYYLENILGTFEEKYPPKHAIWNLLKSKPTKGYLESEKNLQDDLLVDDKDEKVKSVIEWDSCDDYPDSLQNQMKMDMAESQVPVDLAAIIVAHIASTTEDGAILIFLPGSRSIHTAETVLRTQNLFGVDFNDEEKFKIFLLHSAISGGNKEVFRPVPPGCRKIILATNVAETSITINDVQYVVDTGKHRENNFHQMLRISSLPCKWISKSSVKQRSGRAGRVQNGSYYALFSKRRYDSLRTVARPEMLRIDLQRTCLEIKVLGYGKSIEDFLAGCPEPPSPQAVQSSIESLQTLGALTDTGMITPLGRLLGMLPLRPALGKMVILGIIFRCLEPMVILGALDGELLQLKPPNMEAQSDASMRGFAKASNSDHIATLNSFCALRDVEKVDGPRVMRSFAHQKFLSVPKYQRVKQTVGAIQHALELSGLVANARTASGGGAKDGVDPLNENSKDYDLIRTLLVHGSYPHIGTWDRNTSMYQIVANEKAFVSVSPSSINHPLQQPVLQVKGPPRLLCFNTLALITDHKLIMQRTTAVTPFMVSLFSGSLNQSDVDRDQIEVDKWLPFEVQSTSERRGEGGAAARIFLEFKNALRQWEETAIRDLAKGEYILDNQMSLIFANALKRLLVAQQNMERGAKERAVDSAWNLQNVWNTSNTFIRRTPGRLVRWVV
ncbi:hypothetical protein NHQ30_009647 [Ciborinia camelliae]|nr:hypothetical protein NHQ30_009647 [Ciborinia camelliae]